MVEIICSSCKGTPYGAPKFWSWLLCVCGTCQGSGKIDVDFRSYLRYIFSGRCPVKAVVRVIQKQYK
jgi:DnaJ-class molecular chaperone